MFDFLKEVSTIERTLWFVAIPTTIIFLLVAASTLFGMGGEEAETGDIDVDADVDVDADGDSHSHHSIWSTISFKNLVYFFTFFSWTGLTIIEFGLHKGLAVAIAVVIAVVLTFLMNLLFMFLLKFQEDSTTKIEDAEGKTGEVYLTIPKGKTGKVELILNGARRIYEAKSYNARIPTGTKVMITDVDKEHGILIVNKDV